MQAEIWYIRHGETEWNRNRRCQGHSDTSLNDRGRQQALRLGERLEDVHFDAVYASDLDRCVETARLALPEATPMVDPRLRELHYGCFEGRHWDTLGEDERLELEDWRADPFQIRLRDGESLADVTARLKAWRAELPEQGRFAVFTHGQLILCALWLVTGAPQGWAWTVQFKNCSITRMRVGPAQTAILSVNDCGHLWKAKPGQGRTSVATTGPL